MHAVPIGASCGRRRLLLLAKPACLSCKDSAVHGSQILSICMWFQTSYSISSLYSLCVAGIQQSHFSECGTLTVVGLALQAVVSSCNYLWEQDMNTRSAGALESG